MQIANVHTIEVEQLAHLVWSSCLKNILSGSVFLISIRPVSPNWEIPFEMKRQVRKTVMLRYILEHFNNYWSLSRYGWMYIFMIICHRAVHYQNSSPSSKLCLGYYSLIHQITYLLLTPVHNTESFLQTVQIETK